MKAPTVERANEYACQITFWLRLRCLLSKDEDIALVVHSQAGDITTDHLAAFSYYASDTRNTKPIYPQKRKPVQKKWMIILEFQATRLQKDGLERNSGSWKPEASQEALQVTGDSDLACAGGGHYRVL